MKRTICILFLSSLLLASCSVKFPNVTNTTSEVEEDSKEGVTQDETSFQSPFVPDPFELTRISQMSMEDYAMEVQRALYLGEASCEGIFCWSAAVEEDSAIFQSMLQNNPLDVAYANYNWGACDNPQEVNDQFTRWWRNEAEATCQQLEMFLAEDGESVTQWYDDFIRLDEMENSIFMTFYKKNSSFIPSMIRLINSEQILQRYRYAALTLKYIQYLAEKPTGTSEYCNFVFADEPFMKSSDAQQFVQYSGILRYRTLLPEQHSYFLLALRDNSIDRAWKKESKGTDEDILFRWQQKCTETLEQLKLEECGMDCKLEEYLALHKQVQTEEIVMVRLVLGEARWSETNVQQTVMLQKILYERSRCLALKYAQFLMESQEVDISAIGTLPSLQY